MCGCKLRIIFEIFVLGESLAPKFPVPKSPASAILSFILQHLQGDYRGRARRKRMFV